MKRMKYPAISLVLLATVLPLAAKDPSASPEKPTVRVDFPTSMRPSLKGKLEETIEDALLVRYFKLGSNDIQMQMPALDGWRQVKRTPNESFALMHGRAKSAERLSFSLFGSSEFITDFRYETLRGYVEMLNRKHNGSVEVLNEKNQFTNKNTFFILGSTYRLIDYRYKDKKGNTIRAKDYIVFIDNKKYPLLVIRHEGIESQIMRNERRVTDSLRFSMLI